MSEKPIIFSGAMVRALLDGRKTQTRRIIKRDDIVGVADHSLFLRSSPHPLNAEPMPSTVFVRLENNNIVGLLSPYGKIGTKLWVRETFALSVVDPDGGCPEDDPENYDVIYRADDDPTVGEWTNGNGKKIPPPWKPSIHMPRWASRITLEITGVRIERLNEINGNDAIAEGLVDLGIDGARWHWESSAKSGHFAPWRAYRALWEEINGAGSWDANPFVWVIEFKVVKPNLLYTQEELDSADARAQ